MLTEERLNQITALVKSNGSVRVSELVERLDASEATIRRDLNTLDKAGKILKVRGGAVAVNQGYATQDIKVDIRAEQNTEEKEIIAKFASSLIHDHDFVYLDAGTTTGRMIDFLTAKDVSFVTNAAEHAKKLSSKGYVTYILGGEFKADTEATVGTEAIEGVSNYNFTKGFFGTNGVTLKNGFTTPDAKEAALKREAMRNCKERYVLADRTKLGAISSVKFCSFPNATVLTDSVPEEFKKYRNVKQV